MNLPVYLRSRFYPQAISIFYQKIPKLSDLFITPCKEFIITSLWYGFDLPCIMPRDCHKQINEWYHFIGAKI